MDPYMASVLVRIERDAMKPSEEHARVRKEQMLRNNLINEIDDQDANPTNPAEAQEEDLLSSLGKGLVSLQDRLKRARA